VPQRFRNQVAHVNIVLTEKTGRFSGVLAAKSMFREIKMILCFRVFAIFEDFLHCKPLQGRHYKQFRPIKKNHTKKPTVGFLVFGLSDKIFTVRIEKDIKVIECEAVAQQAFVTTNIRESAQVLGGGFRVIFVPSRPFTSHPASILCFSKVQKQLTQVVDFHDSFRYFHIPLLQNQAIRCHPPSCIQRRL
jgi:hypothetical protein